MTDLIERSAELCRTGWSRLGVKEPLETMAGMQRLEGDRTCSRQWKELIDEASFQLETEP